MLHLRKEKKRKKFYESFLLLSLLLTILLPSERERKLPESNDPNSLRLIHTLIQRFPEKTKFQSIPETRNQPNQQESIPIVVYRFCKTVPDSVPIFCRVYRNQPCQETSCRQKGSRKGERTDRNGDMVTASRFSKSIETSSQKYSNFTLVKITNKNKNIFSKLQFKYIYIERRIFNASKPYIHYVKSLRNQLNST